MKHLFSKSFLLLLALSTALAWTGCDDDGDDEPMLSSDTSITSFAFEGLSPRVEGVITGTAITAEVPNGTDLTALVPTIEVAMGATVDPASGVAQDFSTEVTYTVTAEDGTVQDYTATVTEAAPPTAVAETLWERTLRSGGLPPWFTANNDRDIAVAGQYVYVHNNNDKIRVVSADDGTDVNAGAMGFIDGKENFASGNLFLLGTATDSEGRIVASNLRTGSADEFPWNVYVWEDKDASQELLFSYPTPAGRQLGENLAVVGDVRGDGIVYTPGSGFGTENNEVLKFIISGGEVNTTPEVVTLDGVANMGNAPDVYPVSDAMDANMIVAGTGIGGIAEFDANGNLVARLPDNLNEGETALLFTFALDVRPFELDGRKLIATTATDFTNNEATSGFLYIIDYTSGLDKVTAENIIRVPFTPEGNIDTNFNGTGGVDVQVDENSATVYAIITNFGIGAYRVFFEQ